MTTPTTSPEHGAPTAQTPQPTTNYPSSPTNGRPRVTGAPIAPLPFDDPAYVQLVKRRAAPTANDDELAEFLYTAKRLQLDPLARQIYFIRRGRGGDDDESGRASAEVSIDGARLLAERTGEYCGQTPPEWAKVFVNAGDATIVWYPVWPFKSEQPYACRIGVHRRGFAEPLYAVGRFDAYVQHKRGGTVNSMWAKRGPEQLAKCAEALALRQAFPKEMSGVYTDDEMGQADNDAAEQPPRERATVKHVTRKTSGTESPARRQQGTRVAPAATTPAAAATPAAAEPELHEFAIPVDDRREAREAGVTWFPYGPLSFVPLKMTWPTGEHAGAYIIADALLTEAEHKLSEAHERATKAGDAKRVAQLAHSLNWIAAEMTRRADDEATRAHGGQP